VSEDQKQDPSGRAPKRRRRFTLGVSMTLIACLAVPMAWVVNHARIQGNALSAIKRGGGFVMHDFRRSPDGMILNTGTEDTAPSWLRRFVPEHYYRNFNVASLRGPMADDAILAAIDGLEQIDELYLDNSSVTDAGLARLRGLKHLKFLDLSGTEITDAGLANLAGLHELNSLNLSGTQVTDAGLANVVKMRELRTLILEGTRVSDAGLAQLAGLDKLIKLSLNKTQVDDDGLEHLKSNEGLISVSLSGTRVSPAGIAKLKEDMPNLQYIRYP
jgi:Leucine-rich repeat (LRR) protein